MEAKVKNILKSLSRGPFIFNLSHGIMPKTPIKNIEKLIKLVRKEDYNK